jgi:transposase
MIAGAVAGEKPEALWDTKPVVERGVSSAVPSNPNSRLGRLASPVAQGWERMDAVIVGIDVAKDKLDIAVRPSGERFVLARSSAGIDDLAARLGKLDASMVGLEATGGYETVVAASLAAAGLPVVIVNPARVRAFAGALGRRAKTDTIDADVIAHFVEATRPVVRPLPDDATRQLGDLVGRRSQILAMMLAEQQRQKQRPYRTAESHDEEARSAVYTNRSKPEPWT